MIDADQVRQLFDYDPSTGVLSYRVRRGGIVPGQVAGNVNHYGYRQVKIEGKLRPASHIVHLWVTGRWPTEQMDHINGDRADDRWCNLREATRSQNLANRKMFPKNTTGYKGVVYLKVNKKWGAYCRRKYLGSYSTAEEAHEAYVMAAKVEFKEFANAG